jgi:hypothetical protein
VRWRHGAFGQVTIRGRTVSVCSAPLLPRLEQQPPLALEEVDFAEPDCDPDPEAA